jgi:3-dehydroquinate synthase
MQIELKTPIGNTEILTQEDGLQQAKDWIDKNYPDRRIAVVTDSNVDRIYHEQLTKVFRDAMLHVVKAGEESKNLGEIEHLVDKLGEEGFDRNDVITGFGGGMITDLAGFAAASYKRGIKGLTLIPTSLLAMVDAAIGGKTGVNVRAKNDCGAFRPADHILLDPKFLNTLPEREFNAGMAEVIKYAATLDVSLAEDLMKERGEMDLKAILQKSAQAKVNIVQQDVKEGGLRQVLNFGHTFGHAVEKKSDYKLLHGEAVSIGIIYANKIAQKLGKQKPETGEQIKKLLERFKLPTELPEGMTIDDLHEYIVQDKKKSGKEITFIIAPEMGKWEMVKKTPEELVKLAR